MGLTFGALASLAGSIFTLGGTIGVGGSIIGGALGGALSGALIGATIGGLTSLVMGGDIGKGMLFGAIGGAITGGITGFLETGTFLGATSISEGATTLGGGSILGSTPAGPGESIAHIGLPEGVAPKIMKEGVTQGTTGSITGSVSDKVLGSAVEGAFQVGGQMLQGAGAEEKWRAEMDAQIAEAERNRQHEMKMLKTKLAQGGGKVGGGGGSDRDWAAELAENRRQFDAELAQRAKEFAASMDIRKQELYAPMEHEKERTAFAGSTLAQVMVRRGQNTNPNTPSIMRQISQANQPAYGTSSQIPETPVPLTPNPQEVPAQ